MITLSIKAATICFASMCYPALVGVDTPIGQYTLTERITQDPGYGGNVLQFHETDSTVFAIHRLWLLSPSQKREQRLRSDNPRDRVITNGCINVDPPVFELLKQCCIDETFIITP